jgi:hypothetical protein
MNDKAVPLRELYRVREQRRKLQAKVALLEAEKQGWLVEKAQLISAVGKRFVDDCPKQLGTPT